MPVARFPADRVIWDPPAHLEYSTVRQTVSLNGNVPFMNPRSVYAGDPQTPAGWDPFPALSH